jgi:hypothetical protein
MPLLHTPGEPELDEVRNMLGFWMREPRTGPIQGVRVFVTLGALMCDAISAIEIFKQRRAMIELAASRRFDDPIGRPEEAEQYEGRPVVVVTTDDLANLPIPKDYGPQPFLT